MKLKKLSLDESLFGDVAMPQSFELQKDKNSILSNYDDDFSAFELPKEDMQGPKTDIDSGIADLIITAINDEWEAIRAYNSLAQALKYECNGNSAYTAFIDIINEINSEENKHVGQLQEILQMLSPNTKYIDKGREEGRNQFNFTNGRLQIQSWEPKNTSHVNSVGTDVTEMCTITDVDDEM